MSTRNHPIEQEELMAYLDGELATDRAVAAAVHLEHCQECQELASELRKMSQEMMAWEVEESAIDEEIPDEIAVAVEKKKKTTPKRAASRRAWGIMLAPRRVALGGGFALILLIAIGIVVPRYQLMTRKAYLTDHHVTTTEFGPEYGKNAGSIGGNATADARPGALASASSTTQTYAYDSLGKLADQNGALSFSLQDHLSKPGSAGKAAPDDEDVESSDRTTNVPAVPMIARTAGLTLTTKEFDKTRASLDEILKRYHGYLGDLKVSAPAEAGRSLTATLRIPAPQLDSAMAELKKLGRLENEAQGGEEVTQQYVDLEARLKNSQHTEQRLVQMLAQRTGKLQDVLKVELEIDRVRGEIEQMQAEKKELSKRVAYATLSTIINEEYHAKLQGAPPSTGSRFRNAAVEGYNTVVEGLIDVGLFLFSAGPSLLIWAAILFFPARWAWRKIREKTKQAETSAAE